MDHFFPDLEEIWLYCQGRDSYIGEFYIHSFSRGRGKLIVSYIVELVVNMVMISRCQGKRP